jgi:hypothetical protein
MEKKVQVQEVKATLSAVEIIAIIKALPENDQALILSKTSNNDLLAKAKSEEKQALVSLINDTIENSSFFSSLAQPIRNSINAIFETGKDLSKIKSFEDLSSIVESPDFPMPSTERDNKGKIGHYEKLFVRSGITWKLRIAERATRTTTK